MALFNSLKRAFGFEATIDEEEYESAAERNDDNLSGIPTLAPASRQVAEPARTELPLDSAPATKLSAELPVEVADAMLALINEALPPFIRECLDVDAQRRRILEAMGPALEQYAARMAADTRTRALAEMSGDRSKLQTELNSLRTEQSRLESARSEQKDKLLSEQRQKRALQERVRDLEAQVESMEAEKEQYQLEIKSLMNKMRVAEVTESDSDELRHEIDSLRATIDAKDAELAELQSKIAELETPKVLENTLAERKRRRGRPRKEQQLPESSGPDTSSDLDDIDWLLPGGAPAGAPMHSPDPDFGYQPPKITELPQDDAQLTLF